VGLDEANHKMWYFLYTRTPYVVKFSFEFSIQKWLQYLGRFVYHSLGFREPRGM